MQKRLLLAVVLLAIAIPTFAQHKRRVLVEEFTQASCPPCASQNPAFNAKLADADSIVTVIKYQTSWPGTDPMNLQNPGDVADRVSYYGVSGVPNGFLNGKVLANDCSAYEGAPACMEPEELTAAYDELTPVQMSVSHVLSADFDSVYVTVTITSDAALTGDLFLRLAITEREIKFTTAPGTNGELEFSNVMRKLLPNADGTATGAFTAGQSKTFTFGWGLDNFYNLDNIEAAAWLQDDTDGQVWQSARSLPNTDVPGGSFASITLSATNAYKLVCANTFSPVFTLRNTGSAAMTAATIRYRVGNGPWEIYNWTGNLNPNLTTTVTLPAIALTTSGNSGITLQVVSTSNGPITNLVASKGNVTVNAMVDLSVPPVTAEFETPAFPPAGWGFRAAAAGSWEVIGSWVNPSILGAYGQSEGAMYLDFYNIPNGQTAELILPKMDLTAVPAATLTFDYAHTYYDASNINDRLRVDVSTNCGTTWTTIYDKQGAALATVPPQTAIFVPTAADWVAQEVSLNAYAGQSDVLVRLRGTSGYGNLLWMDNLNVQQAVSTKDIVGLNNFKVQPNPARGNTNVFFTLEQTESIQLNVFDAYGKLAQSNNLGDLQAGQHTVELNAAALAAGAYRVVLQTKDGVASTQLVVIK